MTTARSVWSNSVAVLASQGLSHALRILSTILLLAALTRTEYGVLTAAIAFVDPVRALAALGLDTAALRRAGREPTRLPEIMGTLLHLRIRLAGAAFLVCLPLGLFRSSAPGGAIVVVAAALAILPAGITGPLQVAFQARHRMRRIILLPAVASAVHVAAVLLLWSADAPVAAFIAAAALGEMGAALALRVALAREQVGPLVFNRSLARDLIREGLPLAAVNLAVVVYGRLGIWLLEAHGGTGPVADYGAARRLVEPIVMAGGAVAVSATPYLSRLASEGRRTEFVRFLAVVAAVAVVLLVPLAALASHFAERFVLAVKPEYLNGVPAFRWLLAGATAMFLAQVLSAGLVATGRLRTLAALAFVNLAVFTALALPLVRDRLAEGAAMATTGMESLNVLLQAICLAIALREISKSQ